MHSVRCALGLVVLFSATHALAQTGASELVAPQQRARGEHSTVTGLGVESDREHPAPFTLSAKFESGLGQGSFVADEYARNPYAAWAGSIVPAYYPVRALTLSVFAKLAQELTDSELDSERQQVLLYDVQLRARYALPKTPLLGIDPVIEARMYLPTSLISRYETLALGAQARVVLVRELGRFAVGYLGTFRKNFHRSEVPRLDQDGSPPLFLARSGADEPGAIGASNVSFSIQNMLFVSYAPLDDLSLTLYYGMAQAFTYKGYPKDERSRGLVSVQSALLVCRRRGHERGAQD